MNNKIPPEDSTAPSVSPDITGDTGRNAKGQFTAGNKANPHGRPRRTSAAAAAREILERNMPDIIEILVGAAKAGNLAAAKLCVERLVPITRQESAAVDLPTSALPGEFNRQHEAVLQAMASGEVTAESGFLLSCELEASGEARKMPPHVPYGEALELNRREAVRRNRERALRLRR